jgi:5S rRNA maturation endonuclease (ribonuclease M5)
MNEKIREEISRLTASNTLIIVEGKKDKLSLERLGLKNVKEIKGPLFSFIENIKPKEVVILTDLDNEGKKLYKILKSKLTSFGVKVDDKLRKLLLSSKLSHIEGLYRNLENEDSRRNKHQRIMSRD